jgi:hypothetical protein
MEILIKNVSPELSDQLKTLATKSGMSRQIYLQKILQHIADQGLHFPKSDTPAPAGKSAKID